MRVSRCLRLVMLSFAASGAPAMSAPSDFPHQIRPLLSKRCLPCHGPDEQHRKAGLRLDTREGAFGDRDGTRAFVPGKPESSEALRRMKAADPEDRMPPAESGHALRSEEIALVEAWVRQGAPWEEHWSFTPPRRPPLPRSPWPAHRRNEIDAFVQARLAGEGLSPSPPADPHTLARRVALDITGLPPTPQEAEAFVRDSSEAAYEAMVDRLLASPAYGERWARVWLDLARYADSRGYEKDRLRTIWRYRDWVIEAFNRDLPYTEFTVAQIAGDLLPGAGAEQILATAFHRNTLTNEEAGTDDEEFRVAAVKDRVDTTMQVWMGLTMGCAKCHDHKYDPVSQKEYYRLLAFFDQTADSDREDPVVPMPTAEQHKELATAEEKIARLDRALERATAGTRGRQRAWEAAWLSRWAKTLAAAPKDLAPAQLGAWHAVGPFPVEGRAPLSRHLGPEQEPLDFNRTFEGGKYAWQEEKVGEGKLAELKRGSKGQVMYVARTLSVPSARTLRLHLVGGEAMAVWLDGRLLAHDVQSVSPTWPVGPGRHHLLVKLAKKSSGRAFLFHFDLEGEEVGGEPLEVARALLTPRGRRAREARDLLRDHFVRQNGGAAGEALVELESARAERQRLQESFPRIPIMRELPAGKRRTTHVHVRGNFLEKAEAVTPGTPAAFPPLPPEAPRDRLGLARWLVDESNPLTARVAANRHWAQIFGAGLVETEEDFGLQGAPPSHRDLLDWLADELVRQGWSLKKLTRTIVLSATYRQSARVTPLLAMRDPANRLLARGPRFRLEAETIRDTALAAAGLLDRTLYGPSVMPPQPEKIWSVVYSDEKWINSPGSDRHRRGLYTLLRRGSPYPSLITFDAPSREVCSMRRVRSNTPLQALVTLNDPVYVEAAQALARRMLREVNGPARDRIVHGFRLALLRSPSEAELEPLRTLFDRRQRHYRARPAEAKALATEPLGPLEEGSDAVEAAALTAVANVILNLDEFLTKG